jgi:type IV secretion system protein VirB2
MLQNNIRFNWQLCIIFCLCSAISSFSMQDAFAVPLNNLYDGRDAISNVLCAIVDKFNGPLGKGISSLAIIVIGVGLFLGKLNWAVAVATAIGIGLIFGASNMVSWIGSAGLGTLSTAASAACPSTY